MDVTNIIPGFFNKIAKYIITLMKALFNKIFINIIVIPYDNKYISPQPFIDAKIIVTASGCNIKIRLEKSIDTIL